jgi:hypothetical protein
LKNLLKDRSTTDCREISIISEKLVKKSSLHMKGNELISKMEKYFDFSKWTKKMSKNEKPKYSLLTDFFCDDVEILSSQTNLKKIFCDCKIFYIFFGKMI